MGVCPQAAESEVISAIVCEKGLVDLRETVGNSGEDDVFVGVARGEIKIVERYAGLQTHAVGISLRMLGETGEHTEVGIEHRVGITGVVKQTRAPVDGGEGFVGAIGKPVGTEG